ncbi:unnamed protein product [Linum tenue]|uniref:Uncharacterized protein n=1 Tax=Linum tenue TaxID=586396 RepID=A0AAV0MDY5_9ROSI|nr:unnamed protein product [Linum tenue]
MATTTGSKPLPKSTTRRTELISAARHRTLHQRPQHRRFLRSVLSSLHNNNSIYFSLLFYCFHHHRHSVGVELWVGLRRDPRRNWGATGPANSLGRAVGQPSNLRFPTRPSPRRRRRLHPLGPVLIHPRTRQQRFPQQLLPPRVLSLQPHLHRRAVRRRSGQPIQGAAPEVIRCRSEENRRVCIGPDWMRSFRDPSVRY